MDIKTEFAQWDKDAFEKEFNQTLGLLEELLNMEPCLRCEQVDIAEVAIVGLRDALIGRLRGLQGSPDQGRVREILDRTNVALSLVVSLEYPASGIQQQPLQQAYDILKDTSLEEGLSASRPQT